MVTTRARLALMGATTHAVPGVAFDVDLDSFEELSSVREWCDLQGLTHVSLEPLPTGDVRHRLRHGLGGDAIADLPADRRPGARLWMYTNFNCNLACDYCCVSSSPRAPRRTLPADTVERLCAEAASAGVAHIYLTGGEPFLRADIARLVTACASAADTVVLTNGMLFGGARRAWLDACPRESVTLQISIDSAEAALHDLHRGAGSHAGALAGIAIAQELGFRVKVAATLSPADHGEKPGLHRMCDELGLGGEDRVVRRIAQQGCADEGVRVSRASIIPEICITDAGVWWHPVGANDPALRVSDGIPSLGDVIETVTTEFRRHRAESDLIAASFPCG